MPRYLFDIRGSSSTVHDLFGMELLDEAQAIREASIILEQIVQDAGTVEGPRVMVVSIRCETGPCFYEVSTSH
ncbi:MAG: DUF6894 family protein [Janthinobacterium lividum]